MADEVLAREEDGVLLVTVNRPDKLNALNREVLESLSRIFDEARTGNAFALIVTGAGEKAFVAGADISEIRAQAGATGGAGFARFGQAVFTKLETLPIPTIAAINGYALGGGLELAMACDFRFALKAAKLGQPEVNLGIIPGYGGTQRLPRIAGRSFALRLILTGDPVGAEEARSAGLVDQIVDGDVLGAAMAFAQTFKGKSRSAVERAKQAVDNGDGRQMDDALEVEAWFFEETLSHPDAAEGTAAFLEKRKPHFD